MISLLTIFSLMMLPAIAMLAISFVVSVFEGNEKTPLTPNNIDEHDKYSANELVLDL